MIFMSRFGCTDIGGAEIYNKSLYDALVLCSFDISAPKSTLTGSINNQRLKVFFDVLRSGNKYVLANHSGFLDIVLIFCLFILQRQVYVISHVGPGYRHMDNNLSLLFVKFVLRWCVCKNFLLTKKQLNWIHGSNKNNIGLLMPSIIRREFFNKPFNNKKKDQDCDYIFYYGRVSEEKGVFDLIQAFSQSSIPKLKIAGVLDDEIKLRFNSLLESVSLAHRVEYIGPVYNVDELIDYIDNSIFIVYPSHFDLYPLAIFESFIRNKLCLSTYVGDNLEIYKDVTYLTQVGDVEALMYNLESSAYGEMSNYSNFVHEMREDFLKFNPSSVAEIYINEMVLTNG